MRVAVFCKSFRDDFSRLQQLVATYEQFVHPEVRFLLSVPEADIVLARALFAGHDRITIVTDESYSGHSAAGMGGWVHQQLCKLTVHRTDFADIYFAVDSDSYFIRPFAAADFFADGGHPRIVASSVFTGYLPYNDSLLAIIDGKPAPEGHVWLAQADGPKLDLTAVRAASAAMGPGITPGGRGPLLDHVFGRALRDYAYQPCQFLIAGVMRHFEAELAALGTEFRELLVISPWEYNWYGSYCLYSRCASIVPMISPTISFVSEEIVAHATARGVTHEKLAQSFAVVQMAARHLDATRLA